MVTPVDRRSLLQLLRNTALEIIFHHQHIVGSQGIGDYHGPDTVGKLQASHHQIDRNHPSSKEHGKGGHKGKEATKGHILPRERICRQGGQHQVDAGSQHRI